MIPTPHDMPAWAQVLLEISLQAAVLAIVVALVIWLAGRALTPAWRFALWSLVLVRLCLPVSPTSDVSLFALLPNWEADETRAVETESARKTEQDARELKTNNEASNELAPLAHGDMTSLAASGEQPAIIPSGAGDSVSDSIPTNDERRSTAPARADTDAAATSFAFLYPMLLAVWLSGVALLCVRQLLQALRLRRMQTNWQVYSNEQILALLEQCRTRLGVRRTVQLMTADAAIGPATIGWLRPRIVLPAELLESLAAAEFEMILLHELAHIRRGDVLWGRIAQLVAAVHWFNPVAWYVRSQLAREREHACDATVLSNTTLLNMSAERTRSYGELLIRLAARPSAETLPAPAIVPGGKRHHKRQLSRRIEMIAKHDLRRRSRSLGGLVLAVLAITGLTVQAEPVEDVPEKTESQPVGVAEPKIEPSPTESQTGTQDVGDSTANQNATQQDAAQQNADAQATEEQDEQLPYIIVPVTTPLQRLLMRGEDAVRFVLVDGDALVSEDGLTLKLANLDLDRFGRAVNKDLPAGSQVAMRIHYYRGHPEMSRNIRRAPMALSKVLRSMITQYGDVKEPNGGAAIGSNKTFAEDVQALRQPEPEGLKEDPVENEFGAAYPLRTNLSRALQWNEELDCVIDVNPKFDMNPDVEKPDEFWAGLKELAAQVQPDKRRWLLLKTSESGRRGNPFSEEGRRLHDRRDLENARLARELGFESVTRSIGSYKREDNQTP